MSKSIGVIWMEAYLKLCSQKQHSERNKRLAFYGVKAFANNTFEKPTTKEKAQANFIAFEKVMKQLSHLTPSELQKMFPISKRFDGIRHGMKDYFSTRAMINKLNQQKPIGRNTGTFLLNYLNNDIFRFLAHRYEAMDNLLRLQGKSTILERFETESGQNVNAVIKKHKQFI